jgi:hypothetical protein
MNELLNDQEIRHIAISLLTLKTDRDKQTRLGASDLSNGCDFCLAHKFLGIDRSSGRADAAWMGRVLGTGFHGILDGRVQELQAQGDEILEALTGIPAGSHSEHHVVFGTIGTYGEVGGTIDLDLGAQLVDWKGSTRLKICLLIDYIRRTLGLPEIFGRNGKYFEVKTDTSEAKESATLRKLVAKAVKAKTFEAAKAILEDLPEPADIVLYRKAIDALSEKEYEHEMAMMAYKVAGYYGQQTLYMHAREDLVRASLVLLARDGTGFFDNPAGARYDDETAVRDVHVLSFDYSKEYAEALLARALAIWEFLEAGGKPTAFERHELCHACGEELQAEADAAKAVDQEFDFPGEHILAA